MKCLTGKTAYIFDLDGTLADSMHVWDSIAEDWLMAQGLTPEKNLEKIIADMTLGQSAQYMAKKYAIKKEIEQIVEEWMHMVYMEYAHRIPLKEGVVDFLRQCKKKGIRMAIATSCFPKACDVFLQRTGIHDFFEEIVYTDETSQDKTHPDIYQLAAERLHVSPSQCVVFEDTYSTLQGARKAGMQIVAVYDDCCTNWQEFSLKADGNIRGFNNLVI